MLKIFRSNQPGVILFLLVYLAILKIKLFIAPAELELESTAPLSALLYHLLDWINFHNYYVIVGISCFFIFIQALMIKFISDRHKLAEEYTYLPALSYILLTSLFDSFTFLSPPLLAAFFVIVSVDQVFSMYKSEKADNALFDVGFYVGVASLFYFPALALMIWVFVAVSILKAFKFREWVIMFIGLAVPYFLTATYYIWVNELPYVYESHLSSIVESRKILLDWNTYFFIKMGVLAVITVIYIFFMLRNTGHGVIQLRKSVQIILILLLFAVLSITLEPKVGINQLFLLTIPLSFVFGYAFAKFEPDEWTEVPHFILFITILIIQYLIFVRFPGIF